MFRLLCILSLVVVALGCSEDVPASTVGADDAAAILDIGEGGAADAAGFAVTEVGAAGRWEIEIAALPPRTEASIDNLDGVAYAFRLRLESTASVAFMARVVDGNVDPHVVLKAIGGETIAIGRDQAILPMAAEQSAVVTFDAEGGGDYIFIVADEDLEGAGRVVVDVVLLAEPLGSDLGWTDAGVRAIAQELREREPELSVRLSEGAVLEGVDGYLTVGDLTSVPLRDRATINGLVSGVVDLRGLLYERFGEDEHPAVGRAAAELFWAARAP